MIFNKTLFVVVVHCPTLSTTVHPSTLPTEAIVPPLNQLRGSKDRTRTRRPLDRNFVAWEACRDPRSATN